MNDDRTEVQPEKTTSLKPAMQRGAPLHRTIYEQLLAEIQNGTYRDGDRLPSEAALCERFSASRITVGKALGALQRERVVRRRAGSGTFVQQVTAPGTSFRFGLLIPGLGDTEIFEPVCRGMMTSPLARSHSLTWGLSPMEGERPERAAEELCKQFISQKLNGVFFAPIEFAPDRDKINRRIVESLERAGIAIVLLDRCVERFPNRSRYDLVGIDNHRAGALITRHMLDAGAKRPLFLSRQGAAPTVCARESGFRTTLLDAGMRCPGVAYVGDVEDSSLLEDLIAKEQPDALVCANDRIAASVMRCLMDRGIAVPQQIKVSGFDDVKYAQYLPVPLTTIHQNCAEMGRAAMALMLSRLQQPTRASRDVLIDFQLIVRESTHCKGHSRNPAPREAHA